MPLEDWGGGARRFTEEKSLAHLEFWLLNILVGLGVLTRTLSFPNAVGGHCPGWRGKHVEWTVPALARAAMVNSLESEARREEGRHGPQVPTQPNPDTHLVPVSKEGG